MNTKYALIQDLRLLTISAQYLCRRMLKPSAHEGFCSCVMLQLEQRSFVCIKDFQGKIHVGALLCKLLSTRSRDRVFKFAAESQLRRVRAETVFEDAFIERGL